MYSAVHSFSAILWFQAERISQLKLRKKGDLAFELLTLELGNGAQSEKRLAVGHEAFVGD